MLHASPDAAAVDVQVRPIPDGAWSTVATDIGFGEASRYVRLDPGTHDVQLLAAGTDELVHVVADVVGDAGSAQTVNLVGLAGPRAGQSGLRTLVLPDGSDADPAAALADQTPVVDTDVVRATPVPHRYIHGRIGDAAFQLALPLDWNGKLLTTSRGFSGTEFSNDGNYKNVALRRGYVYAASDEGWFRLTIADEPEDSYYESRRRLAELTQHAAGVAAAQYGRAVERSVFAGPSNGGHHAKWLIESFPALYDGGVSMYGYNSGLEMWRAFPIFLRNYDVIEPRIADIIAARGGDVTPPLTRKQAKALEAIYSVPARLRNGFRYDVGRGQGSEHEWPAAYAAQVGYLTDSIGEWDPTYDPDRDGQVSLDELKAWNPYHAPAKAQAEMRLLDLTGDLRRPIIVGQGSADPIVSPGRPPPISNWSRGPSAVTTRCAPTSSPGWVTAAAPRAVRRGRPRRSRGVDHLPADGRRRRRPARHRHRARTTAAPVGLRMASPPPGGGASAPGDVEHDVDVAARGVRVRAALVRLGHERLGVGLMRAPGRHFQAARRARSGRRRSRRCRRGR